VRFAGKLVGGLLGFAATRHPIGIAAGLALGHAWDRGWFADWLPAPGQAKRDLVGPLFTLAAHVARADGRVSPAEVAATERLMERLGLAPRRRKDAIAAFQRARHGEAAVEPAIAALREYCGYAGTEKLVMLEVLLDVAEADGVLVPAARGVLEAIASGLDLAPGLLDERLAARRAGGARAATYDDPYAVLGTRADAADDEVRAAWRRAIGQHHPDRDTTPDAASRAAAINAAWEQIRRQRGLS
jgi:DnaJ like chaperone protein